MREIYYTLFFLGIGLLLYGIYLATSQIFQLGPAALGIGSVGTILIILSTYGLYDWNLNH